MADRDPIKIGFPWHYRGEGNSSLVLASPSTRTTLRLRKLLPAQSSGISNNFKNAETSPTAIVDYVHSVIKKMLSYPGWIPKMTIVQVENHLVELIKNLDIERDPHRRPGSHTFHASAILMPDLCFLSSISIENSIESAEVCHSFSVELKPKEGVMPTDLAAHEVRRRYSKYTLKQRLKVEEGIIASANDYDPLDFFSGDRLRMEKCLRSLIKNPQNNFRLFANGRLVFGNGDPEVSFITQLKWIFSSNGYESRDLMKSFFELVIKALLKPKAHCDSIYPGLHPFSILGGLLEAQKKGTVDIEPIYPQYLSILSLFSSHPGLREKLGVDGPDYKNTPFWSCDLLDSIPELNSDNVVALKNLRNYLASATVKDCSLFLTFSFHSDCAQSLERHFTTISVQGMPELLYQANLIDLDPKPFERVEKHFLEAKKLIQLAEQIQ